MSTATGSADLERARHGHLVHWLEPVSDTEYAATPLTTHASHEPGPGPGRVTRSKPRGESVCLIAMRARGQPLVRLDSSMKARMTRVHCSGWS